MVVVGGNWGRHCISQEEANDTPRTYTYTHYADDQHPLG